MESPSEHPHSQDRTTPTLESPTNLLRFPVPVADQRVSSWIESVSSTAMSTRSEAPSDEGILGESAYEFIDTDEESRDGNATESVASTDFGPPDDVASLADTEGSGEDSGDEAGPETSSIPDLPGLDHAVEEAFNTPTIGRSSTVIMEDLDKPLVQSIEFEEPFSLGAETVSVKHTVTDFNEEQTANAIKGFTYQSPPKRIVATIRQTMTKQGLSTRDPLRILYVGSHAAKQDIIHKIASCVTASVHSGNRAQHLRYSASQLYNVVPISAFGSERTPEIELMHSSGYQIKVEDCTFAQTLKYEDSPDKADVIKLTLDDNFSCHSVPEGRGFIVEPHWDLPHVAIFYCSDSDSSDAKRTRTIARKFMSRHIIPSIVISHRQLFDRGQCMSLDQHSVHMCLESRDPNGMGNIIHQRFPIDLASFLNIDARQMNRNLAYLTGLHEPLESATPAALFKKTELAFVNSQDLEKTSYLSDSVKFIRNRNGPAFWRAVVPVGVLLFGVFAAVLTGIPGYRFYRVSSAPAISINSKVMSAVPISTSAVTLASPTPTFTSSSVFPAVKTSTRTVTVTQSLTPGPNSLAVVPSMEFAKLPKSAKMLPKSTNKSVCTAEVLGEREILIRIPSATKLSWLTKEAMSVNISRNNVTVDTERAYSSDEGIVLLLPKNETYGVLNISIITTKKPRVNETFQVDFGTLSSRFWQGFWQRMDSLVSFKANLTDLARIRTVAEHVKQEAQAQSQVALGRAEKARRFALVQAALATDSLAALAKAVSLKAAKRSAIMSKEVGIQMSEVKAKLYDESKSLQHIKERWEEGLLKSRVKSKLLWLKLQGKQEEHREYRRRAADAIRARVEEAKKTRKAAAATKKTASWATKKAAKREARAAKRAARKGRI